MHRCHLRQFWKMPIGQTCRELLTQRDDWPLPEYYSIKKNACLRIKAESSRQTNIHPNRQRKNDAACDELELWSYGKQGHPVEQTGHDQRTKKNSEDGAPSAP